MENYKTNIEEMIKEGGKEINKEAKRKGRLFGLTNRPKEGEDIANYVQPTIKDGELLWQKVQNEVNQFSEAIKGEYEVLKQTLKNFRDVKLGLDKDAICLNEDGAPNKHSIISIMIISVLILLIFGSETIFNGFVFQAFGVGLLSSMFMALGFTTATLFAFPLLKMILKHCKTPIQKRIAIIIWIIVITIIFSFLGYYRNEFLAARGAIGEISIVGYVFFNWLFLLAGGVLITKAPSFTELKGIIQEEKNRKIEKKIKALEEKIKLYEQNIESIPWYSNDLKKIIEGITQKALYDLLNENMQTRTDGCSRFTYSNSELNINSSKN